MTTNAVILPLSESNYELTVDAIQRLQDGPYDIFVIANVTPSLGTIINTYDIPFNRVKVLDIGQQLEIAADYMRYFIGEYCNTIEHLEKFFDVYNDSLKYCLSLFTAQLRPYDKILYVSNYVSIASSKDLICLFEHEFKQTQLSACFKEDYSKINRFNQFNRLYRFIFKNDPPVQIFGLGIILLNGSTLFNDKFLQNFKNDLPILQLIGAKLREYLQTVLKRSDNLTQYDDFYFMDSILFDICFKPVNIVYSYFKRPKIQIAYQTQETRDNYRTAITSAFVYQTSKPIPDTSKPITDTVIEDNINVENSSEAPIKVNNKPKKQTKKPKKTNKRV